MPESAYSGAPLYVTKLINKLPPIGSWLYQQHSYMPTGCPSSKAPVKDHWHWITCEDGHNEQGWLFSAKLIGGQAPNSAWTETDCLLHLQIHPKLQQMWQLLRLFFLRHWTNTYWFLNRDGLTTLVLWIIFLWVGKSTRPTHQYQKPWQVAPLQCQVDLQGHQHIWQALHTLWILDNKSLHGSSFEENDATWYKCIAALIHQIYNCCYELEYSDRVACSTNPWGIGHFIPSRSGSV
jgi:hypothetical protein